MADSDLADERLGTLIALLAAFGVSTRRLEDSVLRAAARGDSAALLRRLRRMEVLVQGDLDRLADELADWVEDELPLVFEAAGALALVGLGSEAWVWNSNRLAGLALRQNDLWDSAAVALQYAGEDLGRFTSDVRRVARGLEGGAFRSREESLRRVLAGMRSRGMATVTYGNGARYPIEAHLSMLFNTHTKLAMAESGLREWNRLGVQFVELTDGPECGLFSHRGLPLADGEVIPIELYQAFPVAHPNCIRGAIPRPDLTEDRYGNLVEVPEDAENAEVVLAEATAVLEAASLRLAAEARR